MAQRICDKLSEIKNDLFSFREIDSLGELCDTVSDILIQINMQKSLNQTVQSLREGRSPPVRRITFNIKGLCDGKDESNSRWQKLQALSFEALILCTVSFPGLVSLATEQFTWLVNNADLYLEAQELSPSWIESDPVRSVIAKTPKRENTMKFLENYHKFEIRQCNNGRSPIGQSRKRSRTGSTPEASPEKRSHVRDEQTPTVPLLTMPFKVEAAEVILSYLREGWDDELNITFPQPQVHLPFLVIPYHLCSRIMETYGAYRIRPL
ncbi:hypothetical protein K458DRAFT_433966 [Lentithecium fluviatile CBS 122367]|uniref:Uncharacterized protein n=1 Tax=Lentithecium fluviatile CBS 122367 TaxID=1168545 RepID=A0A6G1ITA8_9PLEO|nr:hypothetical protein K458DRAFT_433966 [Lentithecium fluviatile CBS 122367]